MKILNIPNFYYPNIGGIEQTARDMTRAFLAQGVTEQKVLCVNRTEKETRHEFIDGIEVVRCGYTAKIRSQVMSKDFPQELRKLMDEFAPDVVVLHYPNPFTLSMLMKFASRPFRLILYWHSDIVKQKLLGKLFFGLEDRAARRADLIIATSPNYIEGSRVLSAHRDKCRVVPSCIDEERFVVTPEIAERAETIRKEHAGKTLCFAFGRHVPYKGFEYLEKAEKYLPPDIDVMIGDRLSQEDLIAYLSACDIFCFPSITKNEAFGLGLAEGMLFGHPAVTFTIPGSGVNYVSLHGVTGLECPNRDAKAYADALIKLSKDPALRSSLGKNARQRVLDNFTYPGYARTIFETITEGN